MLKVIKWILVVVASLMLLIILGAYLQLKDRHQDYKVDININDNPEGQLKVGFSAISITPELADTWTDANGDSRYFEEDGDTYHDNNGNGKFDPVWMAGFSNRRPANGIHDDLWARAIVIDDGSSRIAIISLDAIGFGNDDVIATRKLIPESAAIDYCIITSTHTHEAPDLVGIWGESEFSSGVDPDYLTMVKEKVVQAAISAVENLKPSFLRISEDKDSALDLMEDGRFPMVFDPGVRMIQAISINDSSTLGTLFSWANHPEVLWDKNLLITSDFVHYAREYTEKGIFHNDSLVLEGLGGITVYVNGAIGGLMTTSPDKEIRDPITGNTLKEPTFEKADAVGKRLAMIGLESLNTDKVDTIHTGSLNIRAKTTYFDLKNPLFRLAAVIGVIDRGITGWFKMRSEIAFWSLGPMSFVHVPGEIYPEIINGGIEAPDGQDYSMEPVEVPPIRELMPGKYKFVVGLSNDLIGYIIPQSQWDHKDPPTYGYEESPYGEINSLGPETAPKLYNELAEIIK